MQTDRHRSGVHKFRVNKLCVVASDIFSIIMAFHTKMFQFVRTEQRLSDKSTSMVHRSLLTCSALARNVPHLTHLTRRIWRWLLDICKICGPLRQTAMTRLTVAFRKPMNAWLWLPSRRRWDLRSWNITRHVVVIHYRRFGISYRSRNRFLDTWRWDLQVVPKRR
jgi:hypothetical protein